MPRLVPLSVVDQNLSNALIWKVKLLEKKETLSDYHFFFLNCNRTWGGDRWVGMVIHPYLLLKSKDVANATIDRVLDPYESLITKSSHRVEAFVGRNSQKHCWLRRSEWCLGLSQNMVQTCNPLYTSKELAGTTRPTTTSVLTTHH